MKKQLLFLVVLIAIGLAAQINNPGGGSGSMTWPAAAGIAVCTGTPCTAWGTSKASPTGTIVGTSDTQALTSKDLTGAGNTFPTFNQNTTGSAAKWTTARTLGGNSVDGSANVAFANKFLVQGTADTGLSGAQFMGSLGTGIVKNTTTTGVQSIAVAADLPITGSSTEALDGFLTTGSPPIPFSPGTLTTGIPVLGTMYMTQFVPTRNYKVGHVGMYLVTTQASGVGYACIYDSSGTTLLFSLSSTINLAGTSGSAQVGSGTQVTLSAGTTYLIGIGQSGSVTGATVETYPSTANAANYNALLAAVGATPNFWFGTSANSLTTGPGCPSGTGTVTAASTALAVYPLAIMTP